MGYTHHNAVAKDNTTFAMNKHSFWYWTVFVLLTIWQLPQFLVAVVMLPFMGKLTVVRDGHFNICFRASKMSGGISLGPFAYVSDSRARCDEVIAHEFDGHTVDSKIFGPLYLFIVGIPSILNAIFSFTDCYYDWYPECWANKHAGLEVDKYGNLRYKHKSTLKSTLK